MSFKEKHLKQAFGPLCMAALMLVPTGCNNDKKAYDVEKGQSGLLDTVPYESMDKYGSKVILHQVNIPVYNANGERKAAQWHLTHGLKHSDYVPDTSRTYIRKAYINNSTDATYVKVDRCNAVITESGFHGLFVDGDKVVVVHDDNVEKFKGDHSVVVAHTPANRKSDIPAKPILIDAPEDNVADDSLIIAATKADTLFNDTAKHMPDTIARKTTAPVVADTIRGLHQETR